LFMICSNIKLTWQEESIGIGVYDFHEQYQRDRWNLSAPPALSLVRGNDIRNGRRKTP
jgi:hypothetical protein